MKPKTPRLNVRIHATYDRVTVKVADQTLIYEVPGMLTGADLADVLRAAGVKTSYRFVE
jgi:hypothetical protein